MTDFNYDPSADQAESYEWQGASSDLWSTSIDFRQLGDDAWQASDYDTMHEMYDLQYQFQDYSDQAYQAAWDAWNGPINAEGYTMHDASLGYSSMDTSFIEPASSAGSMSMISDNSAESVL